MHVLTDCVVSARLHLQARPSSPDGASGDINRRLPRSTPVLVGSAHARVSRRNEATRPNFRHSVRHLWSSCWIGPQRRRPSHDRSATRTIGSDTAQPSPAHSQLLCAEGCACIGTPPCFSTVTTPGLVLRADGDFCDRCPRCGLVGSRTQNSEVTQRTQLPLPSRTTAPCSWWRPSTSAPALPAMWSSYVRE